MNWNEKYRPHKISEIYGQEHATAVLATISQRIKKTGDDGDMPHFLFYGPPGTGKTATVYAFIEDTFGEAGLMNLREFNASEVRVDDLRNEVMELCKTKPVGEYTLEDGTKVPMKLRFIFFDEVDRLNDKAQGMMRRIIEQYADRVRWFFSCNDIYRVIDAIIDRTVYFRFRKLRYDAFVMSLRRIINDYNLQITEEAMKLIYQRSSGSVRRGQNILFKAHMISKTIDEKVIEAISDKTNEEIFKKVLLPVLATKSEAKYKEAKELIYDLMMKGYTVPEIIVDFFEGIDDEPNIPPLLKKDIEGQLMEIYYKSYFVEKPEIMLYGWMRKFVEVP